MFLFQGYLFGNPLVPTVQTVTLIDKEVEDHFPATAVAEEVGAVEMAYPMAEEVEGISPCYSNFHVYSEYGILFIGDSTPFHGCCMNPCTRCICNISGTTGLVMSVMSTTGQASLPMGLGLLGLAGCIFSGFLFSTYHISRHIRREVEAEAQLVPLMTDPTTSLRMSALAPLRGAGGSLRASKEIHQTHCEEMDR